MQATSPGRLASELTSLSVPSTSPRLVPRDSRLPTGKNRYPWNEVAYSPVLNSFEPKAIALYECNICFRGGGGGGGGGGEGISSRFCYSIDKTRTRDLKKWEWREMSDLRILCVIYLETNKRQFRKYLCIYLGDI